MSCVCHLFDPFAEHIEVPYEGRGLGDFLVRIEPDGARWCHGCCFAPGTGHDVAAYPAKDDQRDVWLRRKPKE